MKFLNHLLGVPQPAHVERVAALIRKNKFEIDSLIADTFDGRPMLFMSIIRPLTNADRMMSDYERSQRAQRGIEAHYGPHAFYFGSRIMADVELQDEHAYRRRNNVAELPIPGKR